MTTTAGEILKRASILLQDTDNVRWPLTELADWINEAQRAIVLAKPSANSQSVALTLVAGALQSLTTASHLILLRITRNLETASPRVGGRVIRPTTRDILDGSDPNWQVVDDDCVRSEVRQYVYDEENPREFYVYPPNDGEGIIEAVVGVLPTMIATTGTALSDYTALSIGLPEPYAPVILDYIMFRALSKDDPAANITRAQVYYQSFATAVGLKLQVELTNSPNIKAGIKRT